MRIPCGKLKKLYVAIEHLVGKNKNSGIEGISFPVAARKYCNQKQLKEGKFCLLAPEGASIRLGGVMAAGDKSGKPRESISTAHKKQSPGTGREVVDIQS